MKRFQTMVSLSLVGAGLLLSGTVQAGIRVQQDPEASRLQKGASGLSPFEVSIWNTADFQRRLAESYLSETDIEPSINEDEREVMIEVVQAISDEHLDDARQGLETIAGSTASAVVDFTLGNLHLQQEEFSLAVAAYGKATDKFRNFRRAWDNLGIAHYRLGNWAQAIEAYTRVIELGGMNALTFGLLGVAHSRLEDPISAESAFRMATMLQPDNVDWKMGLADSYFRQDRFADAATLFGTLIAGNPDDAKLWLAQGESFARLGRTMEAAQNFEVVDQLGGSTTRSLQNLGDIYANDQLFALSVDAYLRAMEKDPESSLERPLRAAGFIAANQSNDEARRLLDGIEQMRSDSLEDEQRKEILKIRAKIAVADGAGDEEIRLLEEIIALDPLDGDALILLGKNAVRNEEKEKAVFYYERAANLEEFEADAKVLHAQVLVSQKDYAKAIPLLKSAQAIKPREQIADYLEVVERISQGR